MNCYWAVAARRKWRQHAIFWHLVVQHQLGIADSQAGMHDFTIGHVSDIADLGVECFFVKLKGFLGVANNKVRGEGMESRGNSFDTFRHKTSSGRKF